MKKHKLTVLCISLLILACSLKMWAMEDMDDAFVEAEAQKDMLAYVQSTFLYRFGGDLQAGDYVQYEITDHHSEGEEPELCSLEVTERNGDVATIKEEFEGSILYYRINLQNNTLLEYWGYDEYGVEQRPILLSAPEVETRMQTMKSQNTRASNSSLPEGITKPVFSSLAQRENVSLVGRSSLSCTVKALAIMDLGAISPEIREAVREASKLFFSETIPKMLPAKLMANYMDNPDLFIGDNGLVKHSIYKLTDYNKATR